jgi:adenosine deaminase
VDLHLHFEGSVPRETLIEIARRNSHGFGIEGAFDRARSRARESGAFLRLFADCCRVFSVPADYRFAARALGWDLARELGHAEVYVSPEIWSRFGLDPVETLREIDAGFEEAESETGCRLRILLDAVRHWGADAAQRVLDLHERTKLARVVGFGMGGEEGAQPARSFRKVYERARRLGLKTSVHAGEWEGAESVESALDELSPDRIDHGIRAAEDPRLLSRLAREKIPLCVAPTSNLSTGSCESWAAHPLPKLLEAGVEVCLAADDPTIFETSTAREYAAAGRELSIPLDALEKMRATARKSRFG